MNPVVAFVLPTAGMCLRYERTVRLDDAVFLHPGRAANGRCFDIVFVHPSVMWTKYHEEIRVRMKPGAIEAELTANTLQRFA